VTARSYAHDGRVLECVPRPGYAVACDLESVNAPAAADLARRFGLEVDAFLVRWTRLEVEAKLLDLPIGRLLDRARGLRLRTSAPFEVRTYRLDDLVVSVGWRAVAP
jgi:hypothetical protein